MSEHNSPTPAPLLTIIMPVYNVARYLDEAIASVTAQTITDWELIIVDDGSTDGSSEICDRHAVSDNRIRVIHQKKSGVSAARNAALEKARGSIVGFIDGDDTIEPDMYESMIKTMQQTGAEIVVCGYVAEWKSRSRVKLPGLPDRWIGRDEAMKELLHNDRIESMLWDKIYRREVITSKLPVGISYCEDLGVMYRWMNNITRLATVEQPLYHYRMRKSSAINNPSARPRIGRLKVEIERVRFYLTQNYCGISEGDLAAKIVTSAVGAAKYIARYCGKAETEVAFAEIRSLADGWYKKAVEMNAVGDKTKRRYGRLMKSPGLFQLTMKGGRLLQPSRIRKENDRFE